MEVGRGSLGKCGHHGETHIYAKFNDCRFKWSEDMLAQMLHFQLLAVAPPMDQFG